MRLIHVFLMLVVFAPPAVADLDETVGPVSVVLHRDEPAPCLALPAPCVARYDPGPGPGLGDDAVHVEQMVSSAEVRVDAPAGQASESVDLRHASVDDPLFPDYHALHGEVAPLVPAAIRNSFDLDATPGGLIVTTPAVYTTGRVVLSDTETWEWDDDYVNYTSVHVPYTTYPRDTDYVVEGTSVPLGVCPLSSVIGNAACAVTATRPVVLGVENVTPDVVLGVELDQIEAHIGPQQGRAVFGRGSAPPSLQALREGAGPQHMLAEGVARPARAAQAAEREPRTHAPALVADRPVIVADVSSSASAESLATPAFVALACLPLALLLYHRITARRAAEQPQRHRILQLLREHPGCDVATLSRLLGLSYKSTSHHVRVLRRAGLIRVASHGRRVIVSLTGSEERALRAVILEQPLRAAVAREVAGHPGIRQADLARRLGVGRSTLHRHVTTLRRAAVIEQRGHGFHPVVDAAGAQQPEPTPA